MVTSDDIVACTPLCVFSLFVVLNTDCYSQDKFIYQKWLFDSRTVKITALQLISQIRCLCVGYSFGGFHLCSLSPLMHICSSPLPQHTPSPAVTHFAYLEPENDPRSFVYLWVATGTSPFVEERCRRMCEYCKGFNLRHQKLA